MNPFTDPFEKHIQGLYKGHEVPAPVSAKENVFKKLDNIRVKGYVSKALLATVVSVAAIAWYYSPDDLVIDNPIPVVQPELVIDNDESTQEDQLQEEIVVVPVIDFVDGIEAEPEEAAAIVTETVPAPEVESIKINDHAATIDVVVEEVVVQPDTTKKPAEKSEEVDDESEEWILGGSIKVEK
jgi:hypothetical protein